MGEYIGSAIVFVIIAVSAFYIVRKIYLSFKNDDASSDCCGGCSSSCSDNCGCSINEYYSDDSGGSGDN